MIASWVTRLVLCSLLASGCTSSEEPIYYVDHEVPISLSNLEVYGCPEVSEYRLVNDPDSVEVRMPEGQLPPDFVEIKPTQLSVKAGFVEAELEAIPGGKFVDSQRVRIWSVVRVE